ncbi:MAG: TolC family protein [Bacteroidota bacterium]|nr:TolC family protein [Bacteroidota bacterium]
MKKILTVALISLFFTAATSAQEKLTLQKVIQTALEKNIDIIRAKNTSQISSANVTTAVGNLLPTVNASANLGRSGSTVTNSARGSAGAGIDASVTLFDGFRNISTLNRASASSDAAEYDYQKRKQDIVLAVEQAYLTVLRNEQLLKVSQDNLKRSQQQLSRIEESNKVGAVAKADVYRQQVQTANDELSLISAQSNYDNSKFDLLYLISIDGDKEYNFTDETVLDQINQLNFDSLQQEYADYNKLVEEALASRPDYQSSVLNKKIAESNLTIARGGHYPRLSAGAGYNFGGTELGTIGQSKTWDAGLTLSVPLFSGFQTSTAVQTSQLDLQLAESSVEQAKRKVGKDVKSALLSLETARKRHEVSLKSVKSAEEDRRIAEERYNLGANTLLDLLIATANYTQAQSNQVSSTYDFVYAKLQFRITVGREKF